jgi:hypothetical protein
VRTRGTPAGLVFWGNEFVPTGDHKAEISLPYWGIKLELERQIFRENRVLQVYLGTELLNLAS